MHAEVALLVIGAGVVGIDLADVQKQVEACAKSKKSLKAAVDQAEQASTGYRAVSVTPKLVDTRSPS